MATLMIGGQPRPLPELNVRRMRFVLPRVQKMQEITGQQAADGTPKEIDAGDVDEILRLACEAVAAWLTPPPLWEPGTAEAEEPTPISREAADRWIARKAVELEEELKASEAAGLGPSVAQALEEGGMPAGELEAALGLAAASPLTNSSTASSATSSPAAPAAAAGTS